MNVDSWSDEPSEEEIRQLEALLARPEVWDEPDQADEDAIVAAILAEAGTVQPADLGDFADSAKSTATGPAGSADSGGAGGSVGSAQPSNVVPISRNRRWVTPILSAAAGLVLALIGVAAVNAIVGRVDGEFELALEATELAPDAEATVTIVDLPAGTRVELDVSQLAPAEPGTYYEVWLRKDAEVGVSAGTFHLRGGDSDDIELWAGVSTSEFPLVTITIQQEADPTSSGRVVLKGLVEEG